MRDFDSCEIGGYEKMKKSSFVKLMLGTVLGLVFALGMCMCLLREWGMFGAGVAMVAVGGLALSAWGAVEFIRHGLHKRPVNIKLVLKIGYVCAAALVLGAGMAMILALDMMLWGLVVGCIGILLALAAIPMFTGFEKD